MEKKIVSLIDDDQVYQTITKHIAEKHKDVKKVLQFYDGEEGINFFKVNKTEKDALPDLILLDINMPYMNGWQFIDELFELKIIGYNPVIYIVTSSSNKEDIDRANHYLQVTGYHVKPVKRENFEAFMMETFAN